MMQRSVALVGLLALHARHTNTGTASSEPALKRSRSQEETCSLIVTYFTRRRGGAAGARGSATMRGRQLKSLERWLERSGKGECRDHLLRSALTLAAASGDVEAVELCLSFGYDVNGRDQNHLTPLHYAGWKGHSEVVTKLLAAGGDPSLYDDFGTTPLHKATAFGHQVIMQQLLRSGRVGVDTQTGPIQAPPSYEAETLHQTPLHLALRPSAGPSSSDRQAMVSTLLDFGACPNVRDVRGRTPLHYAVETGDPMLVWWLRRRGGDPNVKDEEGHTPADRMTWKTAYLAPILYWPA